MSWAETKKINGNLSKSLDTLITEKASALNTLITEKASALTTTVNNKKSVNFSIVTRKVATISYTFSNYEDKKVILSANTPGILTGFNLYFSYADTTSNSIALYIDGQNISNAGFRTSSDQATGYSVGGKSNDYKCLMIPFSTLEIAFVHGNTVSNTMAASGEVSFMLFS